MVHSKVGDFSCRTIGFISLIHPTVLPTAEKRRYEILRKTRLERFAGIGDRAGLPNKIRMLYKVPTPAPNLLDVCFFCKQLAIIFSSRAFANMLPALCKDFCKPLWNDFSSFDCFLFLSGNGVPS